MQILGKLGIGHLVPSVFLGTVRASVRASACKELLLHLVSLQYLK